MSDGGFDRFLGEARARYLAHGYRHVTHRLSDLRSTTDADGVGHTTGTASVAYPRDWSRKSDRGALRPHLSTIDGIVLGARLIEHELTHILGVVPPDVRSAWLTSVDVRAGTRPLEDTEAIPVVCTSQREGEVARCTCRTGPLSVEVVVRLPTSHDVDRTRVDLTQAVRRHLYSDAYKDYEFDSQVVDIDVGRRRMTARHVLISAPRGRLEGLEGAFAPSMTHMDLLRLAAQQAQILVYAVDGVNRTEAGTLWMRRARFVAEAPRRPVDAPIDAVLSVDREQTIERGGRRWRTYRVVIEGVPSMSASADLAYALPHDTGPNRS